MSFHSLELPDLVNSKSESSDWTVGVLLAIIGTFLFALKSIFIKLAYKEGASADEVLLLRMLLAAPFYLGMLIYLYRNLDRTNCSAIQLGNMLKVMALGFIGYYLASYLDLAGLVYITAQLERLTLFTYPTMIAILAWLFLGEAITKMVIISLIFCYLGLWIMYGQEIIHTDLSSGEVTKGVLLVLGSALSYSIYVILAKPMIQKFGSLFFTSIAMLGSTFFVIIHFSLQHPLALSEIASKVWIYAMLLAFVSTVIPSFMIAEAISRIGAARTSILGTAGPVFTIFLAVFVLDEPFTIYHSIGVILVLIGVGCVSRLRKPRIKLN